MSARDSDLAGAEEAMHRAARAARRRAAERRIAPAVFENGKITPARFIRERRLLDPVHGFIAFRSDDVDDLAWRIIDTPEFQRLRNIKQLGLADMVFPGATHSRFSHSIGAFHIARRLIEVVHRELGAEFDHDRAAISVLAALLHDVGHGPFSHAFEKAERDRGAARRHEDWTCDIISGDTGICQMLGDRLSGEIVKLIRQKEPVDIYASVVSSQFDADRLDYLQRDRYMIGSMSGAIDCDWLIDNLRVGTIMARRPDDNAVPGGNGEFIKSEAFYLSRKALSAAEEYLLARYRLYIQVYLHKTSIGAERMLRSLLEKIAELQKKDCADATGLPREHPLLRYYSDNAPLQTYLALDDTTVWGALGSLSESDDDDIAHLALALRTRQLYKCFDVGELAERKGGDSLQRYLMALRERDETCLDDRARLTAYGLHRFDGRGAFQKILIERSGEDRPEDILELSKILQGVGEKRFHRLYAPGNAEWERLVQIWEDVK